MLRHRKEGNRPQKLTSSPSGLNKMAPAPHPLRHLAFLITQHRRGKHKKRAALLNAHNLCQLHHSLGAQKRRDSRTDAADADHEVSSLHDSEDDTRELPDSIDLFPTNNQPVIDTVRKEMLVSLRSSLHSDMITCVHKFSSELQSISDRVSHIENKMGEYATTINDLVDANASKEDDLEMIKVKMVDIEDRSRRNNVKIRGIPESVQQQDLHNYVSQLFNTVMPDMSALDLTVDRIHRLPKPTYLSDNIPRDVILRLHFYHAKERLMAASRQRDQIPAPYSSQQFYADLSQYTLQNAET